MEAATTSTTSQICPRCGSKLSNYHGQIYCLMCGYMPGKDEAPKLQPPPDPATAAVAASEGHTEAATPVGGTPVANPTNNAALGGSEAENQLLSGEMPPAASGQKPRGLIIAAIALVGVVILGGSGLQVFDQIQLAKGKSQISKEKYADAAKTFNSIQWAVFPGTVKQARDLQAKATQWAKDADLVNQADQKEQDGDYSGALTLLLQVSTDYPHFDDVKNKIAEAKTHLSQDDITAAVDNAQTALDNTDNSGDNSPVALDSSGDNSGNIGGDTSGGSDGNSGGDNGGDQGGNTGAQSCPAGQSGTPGNCHPTTCADTHTCPAPKCAAGQIGTPPNCRLPTCREAGKCQSLFGFYAGIKQPNGVVRQDNMMSLNRTPDPGGYTYQRCVADVAKPGAYGELVGIHRFYNQTTQHHYYSLYFDASECLT